MSETAGVPNWTVAVPVAGMSWTEPAWSTPVHRVEPPTAAAWIQHAPLALTVMWYEALGTV